MVEEPRLDAISLAKDALSSLIEAEAAVARQLNPKLLHLVKLRASQINGCAYCIDLHCREARRDGESDQRLLMLNAWEESSLYSEPERAALAWAEALTRVEATHAPKPVFDELKRHFSDPQIAYLTVAIGLINSWNRLSIGLRAKPASEAAATARPKGVAAPAVA